MKNIRATFYLGNCLEEMRKIPTQSVDLILSDIPYGTTQCKWDSVIPFEPMWNHVQRIIKPNGATVLFGSQPFTSALIMSNIKKFKYQWVWCKNSGNGVGIAKIQPLRYHEDICIFANPKSTYYPQPTRRLSEASIKACKKPIRSGSNKGSHLSKTLVPLNIQYDSENKNPSTVLNFKSVPNGGGKKLHSTQKPVDLLEYLIRTYTLEGDTVLDFTFGSCSTGVACINTNRQFIGIELDEMYFNVGVQRCFKHMKSVVH